MRRGTAYRTYGVGECAVPRLTNFINSLSLEVDCSKSARNEESSSPVLGFTNVLRNLGGEVLKNLPKIGKFFALVRHLDQKNSLQRGWRDLLALSLVQHAGTRL
jgi:hypothetical protein